MMTREEAIEALQKFVNGYEKNICGEAVRQNGFVQAIKVVISALRPVSWEQMEKVFPGCKHCTKQKVPFCYDGANDYVYLLTGNGLAAIESDSWEFLVSYCPNCGRPLTDEAVQMVMERMEALQNAD